MVKLLDPGLREDHEDATALDQTQELLLQNKTRTIMFFSDALLRRSPTNRRWSLSQRVLGAQAAIWPLVLFKHVPTKLTTGVSARRR